MFVLIFWQFLRREYYFRFFDRMMKTPTSIDIHIDLQESSSVYFDAQEQEVVAQRRDGVFAFDDDYW